MIKRLLFALLLLCSHTVLWAQNSPISTLSARLEATEKATEMRLPAFDLRQELISDSLEQLNGGIAGKFGYGHSVDVNPANYGKWLGEDQIAALGFGQVGQAGGLAIWVHTFYSPNARSINLMLEEVNLPQGAELYVTNGNGSLVLGPYMGVNIAKDKLLGSGIVNGERLRLLLLVPAAQQAASANAFKVKTVVHGYRSMFAPLDFGTGGSCMVNVACPASFGWENQIKSAFMIINGVRWCSGSMLNNTAEDGSPLALSANHCFTNTVSNWVYVFNYQSATCANPSVEPSLAQQVSGCTMLARNSFSDFLLVSLNQYPPRDYNIFLDGWDKRDIAPLGGTGIHHPEGDIKKISFFSMQSASVAKTAGTPEGWEFSWNLNNATAPGSSGSPLLSKTKKVVGQLWGGGSQCNNNETDIYGKLARSFDKGTTTDTRLREHLDPAVTLADTIEGIFYNCIATKAVLPYKIDFNASLNLPALTDAAPFSYNFGYSVVQYIDAVTASGNALRLSNVGAGPKLFYTPQLNLSNSQNLKLSFSRACAMPSVGSADTLKVKYSVDCGLTWVVAKVYVGNALTTENTTSSNGYVPSAVASWVTDTINLSANLNFTTKLLIAFQISGNTNNALYFDNINILGNSTGLPPVAKVKVSNTIACANTPISFTDESVNSPTGWLWHFPGATPDTSILQNPTVVYGAAGAYNVSLSVTNLQGQSTKVYNQLVTILNPATIGLPMAEGFEGTNYPPAGWTMTSTDSLFFFERSDNAGYYNHNHAIGISANYTGDNAGQATTLYSPSVNPSLLTAPTLSFKYAYKYYQGSNDSLEVVATTNCNATTATLWKMGGFNLQTAGSFNSLYTPLDSADYKTITLLLSPDMASSARLQVGFRNIGGFGNVIWLDSITIKGGNCPTFPVVSIDTICEGGTLKLKAQSSPGATYRWEGPNGYISISQNPQRINAGSTMVGTYRVQASLNGCTTSYAFRTAVINAPPPVVNISRLVDTLLVTNPAPQCSYQWLLNGFILPNEITIRLTITTSGVYTFVQTRKGCSTSTTFNAQTVVGLGNSINAGSVSLQPNPATGYVSLTVPLASVLGVRQMGSQGLQKLEVTFYDALGRIRLAIATLPLSADNGIDGNRGLTTSAIDISMLPAGVYMVKVFNGLTAVPFVGKLIKQ